MTRIESHLKMIDQYVEDARANPDRAQMNLTWIKQAVESIRRIEKEGCR